MLAVARIEHHASAGCKHNVVQGGHPFDHLGLAPAEPGLAFYVEDDGDAHAGACLDFAVAVAKRLAETLGELAADGGFPGAHHAHEEKLVSRLHGGIVATRRRRAGKQRGRRCRPLAVFASLRPQRRPTRCSTMRGVMNTSSSVLLSRRELLRNNTPSNGKSPKNGTFVIMVLMS